jgi:hypothetical protein
MTANTTNGLTYPTGSDAVGDLDTIVQALAQQLDDKLLAAWTAYVPAFTSSGTAPNLGSTGTAVGAYRERGKSIDYRVKLTYGGSGIAGTGNYNIFLPTACKAAVEDTCVGAATLFDSSAGATAGRFGASVFCMVAATGQARIALGGSGGGVWTATAPFAPAAGDIISISGTYERT